MDLLCRAFFIQMLMYPVSVLFVTLFHSALRRLWHLRSALLMSSSGVWCECAVCRSWTGFCTSWPAKVWLTPEHFWPNSLSYLSRTATWVFVWHQLMWMFSLKNPNADASLSVRLFAAYRRRCWWLGPELQVSPLPDSCTTSACRSACVHADYTVRGFCSSNRSYKW